MSRPALLYHAGGLGDFVLSLPAILRLASSCPAAQWHFWGSPDRLILLPGFEAAPPVLRRAGHTLWGTSPDDEVLSWLEGCAAVAAFGGREAPSWAARKEGLALRSFPPAEGPRVPHFQARQLDAAGLPRLPRPCLPAWRRAVLQRRVPGEIVFHPGSGDPKKNLPAEVWAETLDALRRRIGVPVRVIVGPVEQERGGWEGIASPEATTPCENLSDLLAVLGRAALYLGNDSGPAHLAAVLGIPTVAAFGPSNPALWRPLGPRVAVVSSGAECSPCTGGGPIACGEPRCTREVRPSALVEGALRVLDRRPAGDPRKLPEDRR